MSKVALLDHCGTKAKIFDYELNGAVVFSIVAVYVPFKQRPDREAIVPMGMPALPKGSDESKGRHHN